MKSLYLSSKKSQMNVSLLGIYERLEAVLNFSKKFFDFLVLSAPVLRQIARYLPHHRSENASKTHPKSSYDKFKTAS